MDDKDGWREGGSRDIVLSVQLDDDDDDDDEGDDNSNNRIRYTFVCDNLSSRQVNNRSFRFKCYIIHF